MASTIEIINMALGFIGERPVADRSEDRPQAIAASMYYQPALEWLLRQHPWNFAQARTRLALKDLPEGWEREYRFAYAYPNRCQRLHCLITPIGEKVIDRYSIANHEGGKIILCDIPEAVAAYTLTVSDSNVFDSAFVICLARRIQFMIVAYILKEHTTVIQAAERLFAQAFDEAKVQDAREGRQPQDSGNRWKADYNHWGDGIWE